MRDKLFANHNIPCIAKNSFHMLKFAPFLKQNDELHFSANILEDAWLDACVMKLLKTVAILVMNIVHFNAMEKEQVSLISVPMYVKVDYLKNSYQEDTISLMV